MKTDAVKQGRGLRLRDLPGSLFVLAAGHRSVLARHKGVAQLSQNLFDCLDAFDRRSSGEHPRDPDGAPLLVLSAGWRSGSTFVQRLACADNRRILWGEPYGDTGLIEYLTEPLRRISTDLPPPSYILGKSPSAAALSDQWIANLYPELRHLRLAYRAFFDQLFAEPAREAGYESWGIKEVRLTAEHARFLQWLYPGTRIVLLVRNPLDAWRSYAEYKRWYHVRPQQPVFNVTAFCDHWHRVAASFRAHADALNAVLVRYEDIRQPGSELTRLSDYLGVHASASILDKRIRSGDSEPGGYGVVTGEE